MEMLLHESDRSSPATTVDTSEAFYNAKKKLEHAILEFDIVLRTKFAGSYNIEINSYSLTAENITYKFANSGQTTSNSFGTPKEATVIIKDSIARPVLEYTEAV